ncbi:MAG TPA: dTDP-glucose 4,6-dehydratase [Candidatus Omnitrophica bacterium]|nr:dTDP-glucose 4,6-dehydratase [Candidatus Omnitrophota bacterium]
MRKKLHKILVTGGAGFIGSEFVRQGAAKGYRLVVVDKLTYAGDLARLKDARGKFDFIRADICRAESLDAIFKKERPVSVVHFAAESHVDRSIHNAAPFIEANVAGTQILLDISRKYGVKRFVHISTDEVYGDIEKGCFTENSPIAPNSPYAASKAASDLLVKAYCRTHGFPALIARASNNYGPWQYPEKLIPVVILKALKDQKVPVYARGQNIREWLYVSDCAEAVFLILESGKLGEVYNIGSGYEKKNIDTVKRLLGLLGKPNGLISYVKDRPGHDLRYCLDCSKLRSLGWKPRIDFETGTALTVEWNKRHLYWLESKLEALTVYWKKVYRNG